MRFNRGYNHCACRVGAIFLAGFIALQAFGMAGCRSATVSQSLVTELKEGVVVSQAEFWHRLSLKPVVCNDDAFHGLLLYLDNVDSCADYGQRVKTLKDRGLLPEDFNSPANQAVTRGDLAVALTKVIGLKGGLTSRVFGATPRYAVRTLEANGIYTPSSPGQTFSGAEYCGVIGKVQDVREGDPSDAPAIYLPSEVAMMSGRADPLKIRLADQEANKSAADALQAIAMMLTSPEDQVFLLADENTPKSETREAEVPSAIVTGVDGDGAEICYAGKETWEKAVVGMLLYKDTMIRTGPRDAITFSVGGDRGFCVDRMTTAKLSEIQGSGKDLTTVVDLQQGRVRHDLTPQPKKDPDAPVKIRSTIRSPNATLMVRGTQVSLFDQAPYAPRAVSLTGRAWFENTRRQLASFGGTSQVSISGDHISAAEDSKADAQLKQSAQIAITDYQAREISLLLNRGGFMMGDVAVGNLKVNHSELMDLLPGRLNFVLTWNGGSKRRLTDLNLAVVGPSGVAQLLDGAQLKDVKDAVGNPPFVYSMNPTDSLSIKQRNSVPIFQKTSSTGGKIGLNSVGPEGLEIASWSGKSVSNKNYFMIVSDLFGAKLFDGGENLKGIGDQKVKYELSVYLDGQKIYSHSDAIGLYQNQGFPMNASKKQLKSK